MDYQGQHSGTYIDNIIGMINTGGTGNSVLSDNGEYVPLPSSLITELDWDDMDKIEMTAYLTYLHQGLSYKIIYGSDPDSLQYLYQLSSGKTYHMRVDFSTSEQIAMFDNIKVIDTYISIMEDYTIDGSVYGRPLIVKQLFVREEGQQHIPHELTLGMCIYPQESSILAKVNYRKIDGYPAIGTCFASNFTNLHDFLSSPEYFTEKNIETLLSDTDIVPAGDYRTFLPIGDTILRIEQVIGDVDSSYSYEPRLYHFFNSYESETMVMESQDYAPSIDSFTFDSEIGSIIANNSNRSKIIIRSQDLRIVADSDSDEGQLTIYMKIFAYHRDNVPYTIKLKEFETYGLDAPPIASIRIKRAPWRFGITTEYNDSDDILITELPSYSDTSGSKRHTFDNPICFRVYPDMTFERFNTI